jgi:hypothetical protein
MQRSLLLCFGFLSVFLLPTGNINTPPREALNAIRAGDIRRHVDFLASDSLKGRNTPSPELDRAAEYVANEFKSYGVKPINGSYFQNFHVSKVRLGEANSLTITSDGKERIYLIKKDFIPFDMTASKTVAASLVFAGYGITAPEYN